MALAVGAFLFVAGALFTVLAAVTPGNQYSVAFMGGVMLGAGVVFLVVDGVSRR